VALGLYTLYACVLMVVLWDRPDAIFSPWTGLFGIPHFAVWVTALIIATASYARRTARITDGSDRRPPRAGRARS
jgi:hypothetical protein